MLKKLVTYIVNNNKDGLIKSKLLNDEQIFVIKKEGLVDFIKFLKQDKNCDFCILTGIFGVDYPQKEKRLEVVYQLLSKKNNLRVRLKVELTPNETIPSITSIFKNACWHEREVWDMYGVMFTNNSDLRRILTDYGFEGYPLRKDFPLTGYEEVIYDHRRKKVVQAPVKLIQEFRNFDTLSPWEGNINILPGDEKATK